jgi:hypothetical protein
MEMKRMKLALVMVLSMVMTCVPQSSLIGYADEIITEDNGADAVIEENDSTKEAGDVEKNGNAEEAGNAEKDGSVDGIGNVEEADKVDDTGTLEELSGQVESETIRVDAAAEDLLQDESDEGIVIESIEEVDVIEETELAETLLAEENSEMLTALPFDLPEKAYTVSETAITLSEDEPQAFKINPTVSGYYQFATAEPVTGISGEILRAGSSEQLTSCSGDVLQLACDLEKDETYYLLLTSDTEQIVTLNTIYSDLTFPIDNYVRSVKVGSSAELDVTKYISTTAVTLTYQWYKDHKNEDGWIKDAAGSSFTLTVDSNSGSEVRYYCCVTDELKCSRWIEFEIMIDSGLKVRYDEMDNHITVKQNEGTTLKAVVDSDFQVTYQWLDAEDNELKGETKAELRIDKVISNITYKCEVTDGINTERIYFGVSIDSGFKVEECTLYSGYGDIYKVVYASRDGTATLHVNASTACGSLSYQWYEIEDYGDHTEKPISGETDATLQLENLTKDVSYLCKVSDTYYTMEVDFIVYVQTNLTIVDATGECDFRSDNGRSYHYTVKCEENDPVTLQVEANAPSGVRYEWDSDKGEAIDNKFIIENLQNPLHLICRVSDDTVTKWVYFSIYIDTGFTVDTTEKKVVIDENGSATLRVDAAINEPYTLVYSWEHYEYIEQYGYYVWVDMPETSSSITVNGINDVQSYRCRVTDNYEWEEGFVTFRVGTKEILDAVVLNFEQAHEIRENESENAKLIGDVSNYFKFTPTKTGVYEISSAGGGEHTCYLLGTDGFLRSSYGCYNKIRYELQAGNTYYIIISGGFCEVSVTVKCRCIWDDGVVMKKPTCVTKGERTYTCSVHNCKHTYTEPIPATGHTWETKVDKAATCVAGSQHRECRDCHKKEAATAIPATKNHTYGDYVVTKQPTVFEAGEETRTCTVCGGTESEPIARLEPTIKVSTKSLLLKVKQSTTKLKVSGLAEGDSVVSWTSSDEKIVKVDEKTGTVTAQNKTGSATITIKLASTVAGFGQPTKIKVTVQKSSVATSSISGLSKKLTLAKGKTTKLKPVIEPITTTDKVTYKSSNKKVATVRADGVVKAKSAGKATITVTSGKKKFAVTVTVPKAKTTAITGVPTSKSLKKGKSYKLNAKLNPKNSDEGLTYSTSNKKVAVVDKKGKITAKGKGTAKITVKSGSKKVVCVVTVK